MGRDLRRIGDLGTPGSPSPFRSRVEIEVRYAETDQMGVVHHSVYLVWFEQARTRLCLETGYHYAAIEELGFYLVVTQAEARLIRGATYGETVGVSCWLDRLQSRGLRFAYEVDRDGEKLARGATEHIWVERASGKPCRIPPILKDPFEKLRSGAATSA
ncbi:MAG: thioesterase family protein [Acidobacteriota bacterium]